MRAPTRLIITRLSANNKQSLWDFSFDFISEFKFDQNKRLCRDRYDPIFQMRVTSYNEESGIITGVVCAIDKFQSFNHISLMIANPNYNYKSLEGKQIIFAAEALKFVDPTLSLRCSILWAMYNVTDQMYLNDFDDPDRWDLEWKRD